MPQSLVSGPCSSDLSPPRRASPAQGRDAELGGKHKALLIHPGVTGEGKARRANLCEPLVMARMQSRAVMEVVARAFEWGRIYEEKEVNAILKEIHPETATLRRELIDQKIMTREHGRYWLARPLS